MNLEQFMNQSKEFHTKFINTVIKSWKQLITKELLKEYFDDHDITDYNEINSTLLTDICDYYISDLADMINNFIRIPNELFISYEFLDDLLDLVLSEQLEKPIEDHFFKVWRQFILPLTKDKIEFLKHINDKKNDTHKLDIDIMDIQNRDKPFLLIGNELLIGKDESEHGSLINDKKADGKAVAFGHIIDNIAFLDQDRIINPSNFSLSNFEQAIQNEPSLLKAYTMPKNKTVTRLAKKIKRDKN